MISKKRLKGIGIITMFITVVLMNVMVDTIVIKLNTPLTYTGSTTAPAHKLSLWYTRPATNWMNSALPIGNGRLGAMVFGGPDQEHIQFNEKTLWTGSKTSLGSYQNFGDMYFTFPDVTTVADYRRELDLEDAISRVEYKLGTTKLNREYFCSYPDNVMVSRLTASATNQLTFDLTLVDAHPGTTTYAANRITFSGNLDLVSYEGQVLVQNEGGTVTCTSGKISISNANAITILLSGCTNYDASQLDYLGTGLHTRVTNQIDAASVKSFNTLKVNHLNDYHALFNRVDLSLNDSKPIVNTNQLIKEYNDGTRDLALEVLYFQFGRYLTIASSRGLGLPSNLQGIWNTLNNPPWQSDYHSDINLEMNYWPTDSTNLKECFTPFSDYIYNQAIIQDTWKANAGNVGFTLYTQCNPFGYSDWERNNEANAWYCLNLWDHYAFTGNTTYLSTVAYPVMKSACDFWNNTLITDSDGTLVAPNSWSPEHGNPWKENGTTYAQTLIWHLFNNTIKASQILDVDEGFRTALQTLSSQLDPGLRIGNYGQLREWKYQNDVQNEQHRHISHLIGLYPGNQISPLINATYSDAAKVSLIDRGDGGTGWSRAWKICTWARLFDGNHAKALLQNALNLTTVATIDMNNGGGIYENLLDAHPPFQIDGNFGATAGMVEMLLQSNLGMIHLLPALPDEWSKGKVSGLVARGAFEINITWNNSYLTECTITSINGNLAVVKNDAFTHPGQFDVRRMSDNASISYLSNGDTISFNTTTDECYRTTITYVPPA